MSFWQRALDTLIDPNMIALMLSLGVIGIVVELWNPGLVLPGHGRCHLSAGRPLRPPGAAGLGRGRADARALAGLFVTDALVTAHGALTLAGAVTFVIGALCCSTLPDPPTRCRSRRRLRSPGHSRSVRDRALPHRPRRRNPVEVGVGLLVGEQATVRSDGLVAVNGELWQARRIDGSPLPRGERVGRGGRGRSRARRRIRKPNRRDLAP